MPEPSDACCGRLQRDLASLPFPLKVRPPDEASREVMWLLMGCRGDATGIVMHDDLDSEALLAKVAGDVQDFVLEELPARGLRALWPECPRHPGTHPVWAELVDGVAVWECPATRKAVARIGGLDAPLDDGPSGAPSGVTPPAAAR